MKLAACFQLVAVAKAQGKHLQSVQLPSRERTHRPRAEYSANTPEGHPQTYAAMSVLESEGNLETYDLGHSPPTKYGHAPGGRGGSYESTLPVEVEYRGHVLTGAFGVVQTCYEKKTGRSHAVKTINKRRFQFRPRVLQSLQHELEVVSKLSHPSIVRVECCFETADQIQIVMELMPGGDLLDYMLNKHTHRLAEKEARSVMWQVLQAVDYLHGRHIAHRDLKPDNILLIRSMTPADRDVDPPTPVIVKVADFGFAHAVHDLGRTITMIGTPAYLAPEILARSGPYGLAVDMWSLGVLLYIVLSGQLPFNHDPSGLPSIHLGELLNDQALKFTSFEVRDLICGLLCVDPRQRLNIYQAINSPWFRL